MNVSKIYNFNVTKSGVAPFGESISTEPRNYAEERRRSQKKASDFLKGALTVSAVILATTYGIKHGVFRRPPKPQPKPVKKPVEPVVTETIQEIFAKREPVPQIPIRYTQREVPVENNRADRLRRNSIDHLIPVSLVDTAKYAKCKDQDSKNAFWLDFRNKVGDMSYYRQYEALGCFCDFIKTLEPGEVTVTPVSERLKLDNYERFMKRILDFVEKNPKYHEVFLEDEVKYANNYKKFIENSSRLDSRLKNLIFPPVGSKEFADTRYRNNFCRNSMHLISSLPEDKQLEEFKIYLEFIKQIGADKLQGIRIFSLRGISQRNLDSIRKEVTALAKSDSKFKPAVIETLSEEYTNYSVKCPEFQDEIKAFIFDPTKKDDYLNKRRRNDFFMSSKNYIISQPQEKQVEEFKNYLEFIKQIGVENLQGVKFFRFDGLPENSLDGIRKELSAFAKSNPEFKPAVIEVLSEEYTNYSVKCPEFSDEIKALVFGSNKDGKYINTGHIAAFFTNSENYIVKQSPERQVEEFKNYLEFIKNLGSERVKNSILFIPGKYADENNVKIAEEAINFAKNNPEFKDTITRNLIAYEPDHSFSISKKDLSHKEIFEMDINNPRYIMHADNIMKIRKMLMDSGIVLSEDVRLKNRQDWLAIGMPTSNHYMDVFQYSSKIVDMRRAAFELDMKQGITRAEADEMIDILSADTSVKKRSMSDILEELKKENISSDKAQNLFNQLIENKSKVRQKIAEVNWSMVAEDKRQTTVDWLENCIDEINSGSDKIYQEFEQMGLTRKRAETMLRALTTSIERTNTEVKYGMTLDEMIAKINNSVIS